MSINLRDTIISNKYKGEKGSLNKINTLCILPYLPDEIIKYICTFLVSITDYVDYYIEMNYYDENQYENSYLEMLPYILQLHNNPKKEEICKNWEYGEEFLLISKRHEDGNSFYSQGNGWINSFLCDLEQQIKCISKSRSEISQKVKELLKYIMPINKILRINYECSMFGCSDEWTKDLGSHFQKIIDLPITDQNEILSIWGYDCAECFTSAMKSHANKEKSWFIHDPKSSWMCSFVMEFMMNKYH